jgi:flagellin-like protein
MFIFLLLLKQRWRIRRKRRKMNPLMKRKAVSPVIATVILVAVAITVAVGVSYWMGGISAQYTQFEKVEIQTGYSEVVSDAVPASIGWKITMSLKNSGSAASTITHVFINDVPVVLTVTGNDGLTGQDTLPAPTNGVAAGDMGTSITDAGLSLNAGESKTAYLYISNTYGYLSSGTTINIKLHSAGGMDYIKLVRLT